jgi:hypothetical protein
MQVPFYAAETFDLATTTLTYSASLGSAKYTVGKMVYVRLDSGRAPASLNGYVSALWAPGTGTAGTVYLGLYVAAGTSAAGTLYQVGTTATIGAASAGVVRKALSTLSNSVVGGANVGEYLGVPNLEYYAALLVATDAGTDHVDIATSTAFATNEALGEVVADPTTGGLQWPRTCIGAGSSLTAMPVSEAMSGVSTSTALLPWLAVD